MAEEDACDAFRMNLRPANYKENRIARRLAKNQNGKRRVVVVMRERNGRTLPFVFKSEGESVKTIAERVAPNVAIRYRPQVSASGRFNA